MFDLDKKIILVVGGRGYLGRSFCHKLHSQNANVISADLAVTSKAASKSSYEYKSEDDITQFNIDVTDRESVILVVQSILEKFGKIDAMIYSVTAKPSDFYAPFTECSLAGWQSVIHSELDGLFIVAQEVGRVMEKEKSGNMVFISSIYGVVGNDQRIYEDSNLAELYADQKHSIQHKYIYSHSVYPVVKGGVISLTRYLAAYWGNKSIRVNCISPGGVSHEGENEVFVKKYSKRYHLAERPNWMRFLDQLCFWYQMKLAILLDTILLLMGAGPHGNKF